MIVETPDQAIEIATAMLPTELRAPFSFTAARVGDQWIVEGRTPTHPHTLGAVVSASTGEIISSSYYQTAIIDEDL